MGADDFPEFTELDELASTKHGGKIIFATDDWFAVAENLLKDEEPVWKEGLFTEFGKWMDGWETRRKRCAGHDWAIIALKKPSIIRRFCVDTAYFTGNYVPRISIQGARLDKEEIKLFPERHSRLGTAASNEEMYQISRLKSEEWKTIVPMIELGAGYPETQKMHIAVHSNLSWTHLRLNLYPDGGIARFRVYGITNSKSLSLNQGNIIDLIAKKNGGICEKYSNAHYGNPENIIQCGKGINMGDGWETARRLDRPPIIKVDNNGILQVPGSEWAVFKLGNVGMIESVVIDTSHFKGNFPDNAKVEGMVYLSDHITNKHQQVWTTILSTKKLSANKAHVYESKDLDWDGPVSHVKLTIAPDGGISRFRLYGYTSS